MNSASPFTVVMTDHAWPDLGVETSLFSPLGISVTAAHCRTEDEVVRICAGAHALGVIHAPVTGKVIDTLPECKVISMSAVGYNSVDVEAVTDAGILLVNCPDYCVEEAADHTLALILSCVRGIFLFDRRIREQIWDYRSAGMLHRTSDWTLGLLGFGRIARSVARRALGFGMTVQAFDPGKDQAAMDEGRVGKVSLEELLATSDVVSIHVPLTEETRGMIAGPQFGMMKNSAFIVNASRGRIIDEEALLRALTDGTIRGAALDALEKEPPDFSSPLMNLGNVLITPHAAFYSEESVEEVRTRAARAIVDVFRGRLPSHIVNREVLTNGKLRMIVGEDSL